MPTTGRARPLALLCLVVGLLAVFGCAAPGPDRARQTDSGRTAPVLQAGGGPASVGPEVLEAFSVVDVVYLQQMIPHHEQATEIASAALTRSGTPGIRSAAADILAPLPSELREMTLWLTALGLQAESGAAAHAHAGDMSQADVDALVGLAGAEFDRAFIDVMTTHQLGAVELSRSALQTGSNGAVSRLAGSIAEREWVHVLTLRDLTGEIS